MSVISFVILHYGDVQVTKACVNSILQLHTEDDIHMVVVDNDTNKTSEERQILKDTVVLNSHIEVIQMQEKSGFSRANNEGYAYTRKMHKPDYVIMTNNDIVFEQRDFIDKIKRSYEETQYAILSPDVISQETGEHQSPIAIEARKVWQINYTIVMNWFCLKLFPIVYPLIKGQFNTDGSCTDKHVEFQEDIVPCGACIIFSKKFIEEEKIAFSPETDFYYEEFILHYRCKMSQYKIVFDPSMRVLHGDGIATKRSAGDERKRARFIMSHTMHSAKVYKNYIHSRSGEKSYRT